MKWRAVPPERAFACRAPAPRCAAAATGAALVWCAVWIATGSVRSPPPAASALLILQSREPAADVLVGQPGDVRRGRCPTCGFVVGIRELQPAGFEFTVRLRDGSLRISHAASRGSWHIGDAVMLMGGAGVSAQ